MKIIDLLNKIAKGEIPKTIVYDERYFIYDDKRQNYFAYDDSEIDWKYTVMEYINDKIEIIEDTPKEEKKIPEKINNGYTKQSIEDMKEAKFNSNDMVKICNTIGWLMQNRNELSNKIDEIIDYLKSKGDE